MHSIKIPDPLPRQWPNQYGPSATWLRAQLGQLPTFPGYPQGLVAVPETAELAAVEPDILAEAPALDWESPVVTEAEFLAGVGDDLLEPAIARPAQDIFENLRRARDWMEEP